MTHHWITADFLYDGQELLAGHALRVTDGCVTAVDPVSAVDPAALTKKDGTITPGFFDIQVNGGGGYLLNTSPTEKAVRMVADAHRRFGTTGIMPTVITDAPEVLQNAKDAVIAAADHPGIHGIHIEGPHISRSRRGTHDAQFVRPLDDQTLKAISEARRSGLAVLITVAPEIVTPEEIAQLVKMGATVSLGHSDADSQTADQALSAGATGFTHLFNAMSPMLNRSPGITGAAICSEAWCSFIADGIHVDPAMIGIAARARPKENRMIAVSDAMSTVGGPETFTLYGKTIRLQNDQLVNDEGSLAGAHLTMARALQNLISYGFDAQSALHMCITAPAEFLGLDQMVGLVGRMADDILVLNEAYSVQEVGLTHFNVKQPA